MIEGLIKIYINISNMKLGLLNNVFFKYEIGFIKYLFLSFIENKIYIYIYI